MNYTSLRRRLIQLTVCFLLILAQASSAYANPDQNTQAARQAVIIFVDGLSFEDQTTLSTYPHVYKWIQQAGYGAVTLRPAGPRNDPNAYLMTGSGNQALYTDRSGTAYQLEEQYKQGVTVGEWVQQLSGLPEHDLYQNRIAFPGIYRLTQETQDKPFYPTIGLLGSSLRDAGMVAAVYGNADTPWERKRNAALFAMDSNGLIPAGDISESTNLAATGYPYGMKTNYIYIANRVLDEKRAGIQVVELGDLARLYSLKNDLSPYQFKQMHQRILDDIDTFIGTILDKRQANQLVLALSVAPNEQAQKAKSLMTPIMIWSNGQPAGVVTSQTTRQSGVVNGIDLLPTILDWLSISLPSNVIGNPITHNPTITLPYPHFLQEVSRIDHIYQNRSTVMYTYVMLQIFTLVLASILWIWRKRNKQQASFDLRRAVRLWLLAMLFFPALFLLEPLLLGSTPPIVVLGVIVLLAFGGALLVEQFDFPRLLLCIAGFTAVCILIDGFTGAKAMSRSYMGYDPVIAARFYGLGNEYEGVLIGAMILMVSAFYEGWKRKTRLCLILSSSLFAFVLFYMAYPTLGTNAGGFLAGTVGFGIALFRLQNWQIGKKGLLYVGGSLLAGILMLIFLHTSSSQPITHIGRVAQDILSGNWTEVLTMVERKLAMNLRLIRISAWSKVFVVSLLVIGLLSLRPTQFLKSLAVRYPALVRGFGGIIAGSIATLILNDSGIVSAATSIIFFVIPVLYAALLDTEQEAVRG